jgi:hypothetical protein
MGLSSLFACAEPDAWNGCRIGRFWRRPGSGGKALNPADRIPQSRRSEQGLFVTSPAGRQYGGLLLF